MRGRIVCVAAVVLAGVVATGTAPLRAADDAEKVWTGTWRNRKYNTTGPLKCTAKIKDGKTWEGRFQGTFMKDPFDYTVTFAATKKGTGTAFQGKAELDGDGYEWTGALQGKTFTGQFRSLKGYFGEFVLQEAK